MTLAIPPTPFTPEDLLKLEDQGLFELVDGRLVEKQMSSESSKVAGRITHFILSFLEMVEKGDVYPEQTFRCFPDQPNLVRRPDIAVIVGEHAADVEATGHVTVVPDLAIEIVSPNDLIEDFEEKLADYRSAGVRLVWQVSPLHRVIRVYRPDRTLQEFAEGDVITGETVLPGFSIHVRKLFVKEK